MRRLRLSTGLALAGLGLIAGLGTAAPPAVPAAEANFVKSAIESRLFRVKLSRHAVATVADAEVKKLAEALVLEDNKVIEGLIALAERKGLKSPKDMNIERKELFDRLIRVKGVTFEKAFVLTMTKDVKQDADAFTKEAANGQDTDIKEFAARTLPKVKAGLAKVRTLADVMFDG